MTLQNGFPLNNIIHLKPNEVFYAAQAGIERRLAGVTKGLNCDNQTVGVSNWDTDVRGAIAEYAFAVWAGLPFFPPRTIDLFKKPDVEGFQVRSTQLSPKHKNLIVQENDNPNHPYVALKGNYLEWHIMGWMRGKDAKQKKYWTVKENYQPAYWVPHTELETLETLQELICAKKLELSGSSSTPLSSYC